MTIQTSRTIIIQEIHGHTALAGFMVQIEDTNFKARIKDHQGCIGERCGCLKPVYHLDDKPVVLERGSGEMHTLVLAVEADKLVVDWEDVENRR